MGTLSKKSVCVGLRYKAAVCNSIVTWNEGANNIKGFQHQDQVRLYQSTNRIVKKYNKRRQQLRQIRKKYSGKDTSCVTGAYSTKEIPDIELTNSKMKTKAKVNNPGITFVADEDVLGIITGYP